MSYYALVSVLTSCLLPQSSPPNLAETDSFRLCALAVLAGKYSEVPTWKLNAYRRGLEQGVTVRGHVWLTGYYSWEGRDGQIDARGNPCTLRTAAANRLPYGSYLWVAEPCQMRQVLDRGSKRNDAIADRQGCSLWADLWLTRSMDTHITEYATIGGWHGPVRDGDG